MLEFDPTDPRLVSDPAIESVQTLVDQIAEVASLDEAVVAALDDAADSLGDGGSVHAEVPDRPAVTLDAQRIERLRSAAKATPNLPCRIRSTGGSTAWTSCR